jgi:hypothetical protein
VPVVIIYEAVGRSDPVRYERGIMRDDDDGDMVSLTESLNLPTSCICFCSGPFLFRCSRDELKMCFSVAIQLKASELVE